MQFVNLEHHLAESAGSKETNQDGHGLQVSVTVVGGEAGACQNSFLAWEARTFRPETGLLIHLISTTTLAH